jgi:hypothetical protein
MLKEQTGVDRGLHAYLDHPAWNGKLLLSSIAQKRFGCR